MYFSVRHKVSKRVCVWRRGREREREIPFSSVGLSVTPVTHAAIFLLLPVASFAMRRLLWWPVESRAAFFSLLESCAADMWSSPSASFWSAVTQKSFHDFSKYCVYETREVGGMKERDLPFPPAGLLGMLVTGTTIFLLPSHQFCCVSTFSVTSKVKSHTLLSLGWLYRRLIEVTTSVLLMSCNCATEKHQVIYMCMHV